MLKEKRHTDEKHRRFIATLPCVSCGIELSSQAAHVTRRGHSKTAGKEHDYYCVPLCHEGANACHRKFDQYQIMDSQRESLRALGLRLYHAGKDEMKGRKLIREWKQEIKGSE